MCHVDDVEEEMREGWDKRFSSVLDGLKKDQYYSILYNMLQYYAILQETYIEILQSKMESSSSRVVILSMGRTF